MIIKHKQTADYIHWASKIATSENKHANKIIYKTERLVLLGSCSASS